MFWLAQSFMDVREELAKGSICTCSSHNFYTLLFLILKNQTVISNISCMVIDKVIIREPCKKDGCDLLGYSILGIQLVIYKAGDGSDK